MPRRRKELALTSCCLPLPKKQQHPKPNNTQHKQQQQTNPNPRFSTLSLPFQAPRASRRRRRGTCPPLRPILATLRCFTPSASLRPSSRPASARTRKTWFGHPIRIPVHPVTRELPHPSPAYPRFPKNPGGCASLISALRRRRPPPQSAAVPKGETGHAVPASRLTLSTGWFVPRVCILRTTGRQRRHPTQHQRLPARGAGV